MKTYEYTGKNLKDAINTALADLNVKQEDVEIKILSEGGLFQKAKIEILIEEESDKMVKEVSTKVEDVSTKEEIEIAIIKSEFEDVLVEKKSAPEIVVLNQEEQDAITEKLNAFVVKLISSVDEDAKVIMTEDEMHINFNVKSEKASRLIGYRGDGLKALQSLLSQIAKNQNPNAKKVAIDIENYKFRQEQRLVDLTLRLAKKVEETGRTQKLERLNSYERRIVHNILAERPLLRNYSKGEGKNRILFIELKKD